MDTAGIDTVAAAFLLLLTALCVIVLAEAWNDPMLFEGDPELPGFFKEIEDEIAQERKDDAG